MRADTNVGQSGAWLLFTILPLLPAFAHAAVVDGNLQDTIARAAPDERVPVIIEMSDKVALTSLRQLQPAARRETLVRTLEARAEFSQRDLLSFLQRNGIAPTARLWIINALAASVPASLLPQVAKQPGVASVRLDGSVSAPATTYGAPAPGAWNHTAIGADALWQQGYTGQGVVVATMDSGVDPDHPDLATRYRGGTNSWYDPSGEHATPIDRTGHGTQVMGLVLGGDNGGTTVGVAPGAQWIAVKIFDDAGNAPFSGVHAGFQWLLDPDGNPSVDDAPDVVNNSWSLQNVNACNTEFAQDIAVLKAADIAVVFSAGNHGPNPASSSSPANNAEAVAVGAVDESLDIANLSGRGPSACDATVFPELAAPGVNVRTTDLTFGGVIPDSYLNVSGTSYSAPHVSGGIALLRGAVPEAGVAEVESVLAQTALDRGDPGADNDYGNGVPQLLQAYQVLAQNHPRSGSLQFSAANYSVDENAGGIAVAVERTGGSAGEVTVDYATGDDSATAGADYEAASGTLVFADGQTRAEFAVTVYDDTVYEGDETLTLTLGNAGGGASIGDPGAAVLTIVDQDVPGADADGDGFDAPADCNDHDASIHPGAAEIKHDAIDQDCNGYDLTIDVQRAVYRKRLRTLVVAATSELGASAHLVLDGYGPMKWARRAGVWHITVYNVRSNPGTVTVTGVEGSETAATVVKR